MFRHYFSLALRNLSKQWLISLINILGLGFGIAICIMVFLYISHETSFDNFHEKGDRIFRLLGRYVEVNGDAGYSRLHCSEIIEGFPEDIAAVEKCTDFRRAYQWIKRGEKNFQETILFTMPDFLEMFSFPMIAGDINTALDGPQNVVLTKKTADKFFGDTLTDYADMLGLTMTFPAPPHEFMVTGILEDLPDNSSMQFSMIVPFENCRYYPRSNNAMGANEIFLQLSSKDQAAEVEKAANSLIDKYYGELITNSIAFGVLQDSEDNFRFELQPLKNMYLGSEDYGFGYLPRGNRQIINILGIIALFILVIASVNYIMLSIGHSMERLKEMGVMKILGAHKVHIIRQFWSESFVLVILALLIGVVLAEQLLPVFNKLAQKELSFVIYQDVGSYIFLLLLLLIIVFTTSSYIAIVLLRNSNPVAIIKNEISIGKRYRFASTFVVAQYFISITLFICTFIIINQLKYMREKPVGFDQEDVVMLEVDFPEEKIAVMKDKLKQYPSIANVTTSDRNFDRSRSSLDIKDKDGNLVNIRLLRVDYDYFNTLGIEFVAGQNFSPVSPEDTIGHMIVNETFAKAFQLDEPVDELIYFDEYNVWVKIAGVVRDFHYDSMKDEIQPLAMIRQWNSIWYVFIKINEGQVEQGLAAINKTWDEVFPEYQMNRKFLDDHLADRYVGEERLAKITGYSAAAAIFLSCLGLLGLTGLLVSRRVKEIGIRKVNGARISNILTRLNTDFQKWVLIAYILAVPLSYYVMNKWLQNFNFRIHMPWWIFVIAGVIAFLIAFITVTWRSYQYARKNPVETLRYE